MANTGTFANTVQVGGAANTAINFNNSLYINCNATTNNVSGWANVEFDANITAMIPAIVSQLRVADISSAVANSTNISNVETYITAPFFIASGNSVAGDTFRITVCGARMDVEQSSYTFNVRYGTTGSVADPVLVTLVNGTQVGDKKTGIYEQFMVTIRTTGASGVAVASGQNHLGGVPVIGNPIVINTTNNNYLGLSFTTSNKFANIIFTTAIVEQVQ